MLQDNKTTEKQTKKKIKLRPSRLIFLIVLIAANSFAWFIYATKIETNISVHVKGWNVLFEAGDSTVTDTVSFVVDSIYPGMEDYSYDVNAYNRSEVTASLSYVLLSARILDQTYVTVEGRADAGETPVAGDLTSAQLEQKLLNDYPFAISFSLSSTTMYETNGSATYTFEVTWPFESNQDALDTQWGIAAYNYKESNPSNSSIALRAKVIITQNAS